KAARTGNGKGRAISRERGRKRRTVRRENRSTRKGRPGLRRLRRHRNGQDPRQVGAGVQIARGKARSRKEGSRRKACDGARQVKVAAEFTLRRSGFGRAGAVR